MPADSLSAALIAGSEKDANPFLLQYQPEIQLAQGMMGQGFSTAPASPAQALARALTGAIGAGINRSTTSELANVYANQAHKLAPLFKGTPLGAALASNDPSVYLPAVQQVPKAMLINSQRYDLAPGVGSYQGNQPITQNVNPRSEVGIAVQDAQRAAGAGNVPGAQAIESDVTKKISTPSGVVFPPTQVAPQGVPQIAPRGATPASAVPPPENTPQQPQTPAQMPRAIAQAEGVQKAAESSNEEAAKSFAGKETENFTAAQNLQQRLTLMDHNIEALGPSWMGAGANAKAEAGKAWNSVLDSFNVQGHHIDPTKIATWEDFNKETKRAGMELIKSNFGGSREAASIIQMGNTAVSSVENTYLGAKYVNSTIRAGAQAVGDLYNYKKQLYDNGQSLVGAEAVFWKQHPPESYAMGAITSQIPAPAVAHLRANPALAPQFDKQFGANTAEFLLGPRQ